jgi:hypothetical protein
MTAREAADPHGAMRVAEAGAPLCRAKAAVVMVHGRGADAEGMLALAEAFAQPDLAYLAPRAAGRSWYPHSFLAPIEANEPFLSSALRALGGLVERLGAEGFPRRSVWSCSASRRAPASPSNTRRGGRGVTAGWWA